VMMGPFTGPIPRPSWSFELRAVRGLQNRESPLLTGVGLVDKNGGILADTDYRIPYYDPSVSLLAYGHSTFFHEACWQLLVARYSAASGRDIGGDAAFLQRIAVQLSNILLCMPEYEDNELMAT